LANYAYDLQGHPTRLEYANGNIVAYEYDAIDRLAREIHYDNATAENQGNGAVVEYHYDAVHQLALVIDGVSGTSIRWEHGADGRYLGEVRYNTTNPTLFMISNEIFRYTPLDDRKVGSTTYRYRCQIDMWNMQATYETDFTRTKTYTTTKTYWKGASGSNAIISSVEHDQFGRVSNRLSNTSSGDGYYTGYTYAGGGNVHSTSTRLASMSVEMVGTYNFDYDDNGDIIAVRDYHGVLQNQYHYDAKRQLVREDNRPLNWSKEYIYDAFGNICEQTTYAFAAETLGTPISMVAYEYNNNSWTDQLTSYNNVSITYDVMGNPLTYYDGSVFTWENGRHLKTLQKDNAMINYVYDKDGIRQSKTNDNTTTQYAYHNEKLHATQDSDGNTMQFVFDEEGTYHRMIYNGTAYWLRTNIQGDVVAICDGTWNTPIARYVYDAWGNHIVYNSAGNAISDASGQPLSGQEGHLGNLNPIRYRSYVFDMDTGLYYLQARYYDAQVARFLNTDSILVTKDSSTNLYAYCLNNPITYYDSSGCYATVRRGISGGDVRTLQIMLNGLGYVGANGRSLLVDGFFGPQTEFAVRSYQKAKGLILDGIVGPQTWGSLTASRPSSSGVSALAAPSPPPLKPNTNYIVNLASPVQAAPLPASVPKDNIKVERATTHNDGYTYKMTFTIDVKYEYDSTPFLGMQHYSNNGGIISHTVIPQYVKAPLCPVRGPASSQVLADMYHTVYGYDFEIQGTNSGYNIRLRVAETREFRIYSQQNALTQSQKTANATFIYLYLSLNGWSHNAICALLGNMEGESGINPGRAQVGGGGAFGLTQWDGDRRTTMQNWLTQYGYASNGYGSLQGQLQYLLCEVTNPNDEKLGWPWIRNHEIKISFSEFTKSSHSIDALVVMFGQNYERFESGKTGSQIADIRAERKGFAAKWHTYFNKPWEKWGT